MSQQTEGSESNLALSRRNAELLTFLDGALLFVFRAVGNRDDAEDVIQEAYLKAVEARSPVLTGQPLRRWFFRIALNTALNTVRSEQRRRLRERGAAEMKELSAQPERLGMETDELKRSVESQLAALDSKFRTAIVLHYEQGFTFEEAAEITGSPASSLRVYSSQGLKLLRERLDSSDRRVSEAVLLGILTAGVVFKASPALAASVLTITTNAATHSVVASATGKGLASGAEAAVVQTTGMSLKMVAAVILVGVVLAAGMFGMVGVWLIGLSNKPAKYAPPIPTVRPLPRTHVSEQPAPFIVQQNPPVQPRVTPPPKPRDYIVPAEIQAGWIEAVDLLSAVNLPRDSVSGNWSVNGRTLRGQPGQFARLAIPCTPPEEYDLRVDFTRHSGFSDINLIFGVDGKSGTWMMGAQNGTRYCFGYHQKNIDVVTGPLIANGVRHTCIVEVRKGRLAAFVDGQLMQRIEIGRSRYESAADWRLPVDEWIGVGAWDATVDFHAISIREITGKLTFAEPGQLQPDMTDDYWKDAKPLIPSAVDNKHATNGEWRIQAGALSVMAGQSSARYQIDYRPPEEYDLQIDFTRTQGYRGLMLVLVARGRQFMVRLDEDGMTGVDKLGDVGFYEGTATLHTPALKNHVLHRAVIQIRSDRIAIFMDQKMWLNTKIDLQSVNLEGAWALKSKNAMGVGTHKSTLTITSLRIKEVTGKGEVLPPPADVETSPAKPPKAPSGDAF